MMAYDGIAWYGERYGEGISPGTSPTDETEKARHDALIAPGFREGTQTDPAMGQSPSPFTYKRWPRP
jgi:hypothetical protein